VILVKSAYAKDEFAIRPEMIYVNLMDNNQTLLNSKIDSGITLAAGYDYNLTIIATKYAEEIPANGYTKLANSSIEMNSTGLNCQDTSPINEPINFTDGLFQDNTFKHDNVGKYLLKIEDDKEWTEVDQNSSILGCIPDSGERVADENGRVGCDIIVDKFNTEFTFQPDHFNIDLNLLNLPQSTHPDFIYMMELNESNDDVAIAFDGNITAVTENNQSTTNFTKECVSTDILLDLNATTISDNGINQNITTIDNITAVNFSRVIRFNNDTDPNNFDVTNTLEQINTNFSIDSSKFLTENNGSLHLDIRYNLNKNLTQPINPVEVTFNSIEVTSPDANSSAHEKSVYIPSGEEFFTDNVKNFYFARVVSDLNNYPRVNIHVSPLIRTPLNVDIYCDTPIPDYCVDRKVIQNSKVSGSIREQNGYYLSSKHNGDLDGNITALIDEPNILTITPNPSSDSANNISLPHGETGITNVVFDNCSSPQVKVKIVTHPSLAFNPSEFTVNCTDIDPSQWAGIGKTGNVLKIQPKINESGKMDW